MMSIVMALKKREKKIKGSRYQTEKNELISSPQDLLEILNDNVFCEGEIQYAMLLHLGNWY